MDGFFFHDHLLNCYFSLFVPDGYNLRDITSVALFFLLPVDDDAVNNCVNTAAGTAAGGIKNCMAGQIKDFLIVISKKEKIHHRFRNDLSMIRLFRSRKLKKIIFQMFTSRPTGINPKPPDASGSASTPSEENWNPMMNDMFQYNLSQIGMYSINNLYL